jgi:hypothetical protein
MIVESGRLSQNREKLRQDKDFYDIKHHKHVLEDWKYVTEAKAMIRSNQQLQMDYASLKSEMVDLEFKLEYQAKLSYEKDLKMKDLEMEVFALKERSSHLEVEKTQSLMNMTRIDQNQELTISMLKEEKADTQNILSNLLRNYFSDYENHFPSSSSRELLSLVQHHIEKVVNKKRTNKITKRAKSPQTRSGSRTGYRDIDLRSSNSGKRTRGDGASLRRATSASRKNSTQMSSKFQGSRRTSKDVT